MSKTEIQFTASICDICKSEKVNRMKNIFILILVTTCISGRSMAQSPDVLNKFQSVYIYPLKYPNGKEDMYDIRKTVAEKLTSCGMPIFLDETQIPGDAMKKPCSIVHCLIGQSSASGSDAAEIRILFLNCKNDTVLICSSKAKAQADFQNTKVSFIAATKQALATFNNYQHHFDDESLDNQSAAVERSDSDSIAWNPARKLTWADFKGLAGGGQPADALTYTANESMFNAHSIGNRFNVDSKITCYFIKANSWVKTGKESDYLLNHEQRHFDLSEVSAREYRMKLKKASFSNENFNEELKKITRQVNEKYDKMQEQYDDETDHSRIEAKQKEWNARIDKMLKDLEEYK